ncbi:DUF7619 domain-containing protein [Winogradskyella helgolandensis]|uniref:DUF7619 domain-containing protein n=1 Tax=Winogradskyella helgolandensis TaxID=2697010 RepID=UPI0015C6BA92|nr:T9SS type A sorting domain-containing protein [Winogradskyella helgolandensis]
MKLFYLLLIAILSIQTTQSQIIDIPDANFKDALLNQPVVDQNVNGDFGSYADTNFDGEIQVSEAEAIVSLNISLFQIASLEGIQHFTNLEVLDCNRNSLTTLEPLSGLSSLLSLNCGWNPLASSESISALTNLNWLTCDESDLTELDLSSFSNLTFLDCSKNNITSLNLTGANSIETLKCFDNMLTSLDVTNLTTLKYISCSVNQITQLDVSALVNLEELQCTSNNLSSLDVSGFENLTHLICRYNSLSDLNISNATNLTFLDVRYNELSSLDLSGFENLDSVRINDNNLVSLDVSESSIESLYCQNNQLSTLDITLAPNIRILDCSSNNLASLFVKNGIDQVSLGISGNPNLEFICGDNFQLEDIQNKLDLLGYNTVVNSYCSFNPGGTYFTISGNNILDLDANGCDVSDMPFPNLKFSIDNGTSMYQQIANDSGNYELNVEEGSYTITPILENPDYFSISPTSISVDFTSETSPIIQDFCLIPNGTYSDLEITLIPLNNAVSGFDADYKLIYKNKGTTILSDVIDLTFEDDVLNLTSADPLPDVQIENTLNWNFTNLLPLEERTIFFTMHLNNPMESPALNAGDILNFVGVINPVNGDQTPNDNVTTLNQTIFNSFDPNDKTCLEGSIITPDLIGDYVHYLIRFENIGTINATNVVVKDIIDTTKFNLESLFLIDASHEFDIRIENNSIEFIFENINLPFDDANNDGYVAFKLKTLDTLVEGDMFENDAEIFFDYNYPIDTNIAQTSIEQSLSLVDHQTVNLEIYPNPVKNILTIKAKYPIQSITIYDISGRLIDTVLALNESLFEYDSSELSRGAYVAKIKMDNGIYVKKIVKE